MTIRIHDVLISATFVACSITSLLAGPIRVNQIGYELNGPKVAIYEGTPGSSSFTVKRSGETVFTGTATSGGQPDGWGTGNCSILDFSAVNESGTFTIECGGEESYQFEIGERCLVENTFSQMFECFVDYRVNGGDNLRLLDHSLDEGGNDTYVNLYGGYMEASGDRSKHITHLQFTNYMPTNEIPELVWAFLKAYELDKDAYDADSKGNTIKEEAAWGADYLHRACSPTGYFYATVFTGWGEYENDPWVCAYQGNSSGGYDFKPGEYQTAFREGGGFSIAALARANLIGIAGEFSAADYLATAERAYAHIKANNLSYCDDGQENFLDRMEAALACIELYKATNDAAYKTDANEWVTKMLSTQDDQGFFYCNDGMSRPYWHGASEGLPMLTLSSFLEIENSRDTEIKAAIQKNLEWYAQITAEVSNPYNYVRMYAKPSGGSSRTSFFMPHSNESNYWWQGENARLGCMAGAILVGARAIDPAFIVGDNEYSRLATAQLNWVMGTNPFDNCMLLGSGSNTYPLGPEGGLQGGICNGITASGDDGGIEFLTGEWRGGEQWTPHGSWFVFGASMVSAMRESNVAAEPRIAQRAAQPFTMNSRTAANHLVVSLSNPGNKGATLTLRNLQGQVLAQVSLQQGQSRVELPVGNLAAGVGLLNYATADGKQMTSRCVVR